MMNVKRPRIYNSPQRTRQASETSRQILDVSGALFAERGYAAVTIGDIARSAGVSVATVYIHFPGKAAIVAATVEEIVAGADVSVERVEHVQDAAAQLRTAAQTIRTLNERSWLVTDILRSAHGTDGNLANAWSLWQERHLHAVTRGIAAIDAQGGLRSGLTRDEAIDIFYALTGSDVYRALVRDRGWSPDRYERWLFELAREQLVGVALLE
jgi:AcrR family transcriptional regulator